MVWFWHLPCLLPISNVVKNPWNPIFACFYSNRAFIRDVLLFTTLRYINYAKTTKVYLYWTKIFYLFFRNLITSQQTLYQLRSNMCRLMWNQQRSITQKLSKNGKCTFLLYVRKIMLWTFTKKYDIFSLWDHTYITTWLILGIFDIPPLRGHIY